MVDYIKIVNYIKSYHFSSGTVGALTATIRKVQLTLQENAHKTGVQTN